MTDVAIARNQLITKIRNEQTTHQNWQRETFHPELRHNVEGRRALSDHLDITVPIILLLAEKIFIMEGQTTTQMVPAHVDGANISELEFALNRARELQKIVENGVDGAAIKRIRRLFFGISAYEARKTLTRYVIYGPWGLIRLDFEGLLWAEAERRRKIVVLFRQFVHGATEQHIAADGSQLGLSQKTSLAQREFCTKYYLRQEWILGLDEKYECGGLEALLPDQLPDELSWRSETVMLINVFMYGLILPTRNFSGELGPFPRQSNENKCAEKLECDPRNVAKYRRRLSHNGVLGLLPENNEDRKHERKKMESDDNTPTFRKFEPSNLLKLTPEQRRTKLDVEKMVWFGTYKFKKHLIADVQKALKCGPTKAKEVIDLVKAENEFKLRYRIAKKRMPNQNAGKPRLSPLGKSFYIGLFLENFQLSIANATRMGYMFLNPLGEVTGDESQVSAIKNSIPKQVFEAVHDPKAFANNSEITNFIHHAGFGVQADFIKIAILVTNDVKRPIIILQDDESLDDNVEYVRYSQYAQLEVRARLLVCYVATAQTIIYHKLIPYEPTVRDVKSMIYHILFHHGVFIWLQVDNGGQFIASEIDLLVEDVMSVLWPGIPGYPKKRGGVECAQRVIEDLGSAMSKGFVGRGVGRGERNPNIDATQLLTDLAKQFDDNVKFYNEQNHEFLPIRRQDFFRDRVLKSKIPNLDEKFSHLLFERRNKDGYEVSKVGIRLGPKKFDNYLFDGMWEMINQKVHVFALPGVKRPEFILIQALVNGEKIQNIIGIRGDKITYSQFKSLKDSQAQAIKKYTAHYRDAVHILREAAINKTPLPEIVLNAAEIDQTHNDTDESEPEIIIPEPRNVNFSDDGTDDILKYMGGRRD